jgi:hypothetical protein
MSNKVEQENISMNSAKNSITRRKKMILNLLLSSVMMLLFAASISAQITASISGTVTDKSEAKIPGATVTVTSTETAASRVVVTDDDGNYRVLALPIGSYQMKVEKDGFTTDVRTDVHLTIGQEAVISFNLEVGSIKEEVIVSNEASLVNTTTTSTAGLVGEREVKDLPLNGRSFDNLITLNPGTVNSTGLAQRSGSVGTGNLFSVSGRRPEENRFLLNGIEYTGASIIGETPGGVSGQLLGIDAIREFNVVKDTYSAEYGKRPGGQVSIVTASGTNNFHGSVFEFLRNSALDARNFFDQGKVPPFKRNNFGFAIGGPVIRDKTFIFGNYEGFRQRLGLSTVAIVPDLNARRGFLPDPSNPGQLRNIGLAPGIAKYFELWPLPNGRNFGDGTAESFNNPKQSIREDFFTVRMDHIFSPEDTLYGVYTFDDGDSETPNQDATFARLLVNRSMVLSLEETHIFSPSIINTFRLGFSRATFALNTSVVRSLSIPADSLSFVEGRGIGGVVIGAGVGGSANSAITLTGSAFPQDARVARNLYTIEDGIQVTNGTHSISFGAMFQQLRANEDATVSRNGQVIFPSLASFLQGKPTSIVATLNPTEMGWRSLQGAWYVQDSIRLRPNLTVNLGLRHEFTNGWNESTGRGANFITGPDGRLLTKPLVGNEVFTTNNAKWLFGPRFGVAWDTFSNGKTVFHAGFGMYYGLLDYLGFYLDSNAPFNVQSTLTNIAFPSVVSTTGVTNPNALVTPNGVQADIDTPTVLRWNLRMEQNLNASMSFSVDYIGSHGYHGVTVADLNTAIPTILPDGREFFPVGAPRRNPQLASSLHLVSGVSSFYNAFQLDFSKRFSDGLQFRANYTFSKNIDESSQLTGTRGTGSQQNLLDPDNPRLDRGLSGLDVRHRFNFAGTYELPIGAGKPFLSGAKGVTQKLLGGWQLNAIVNLQSGFPFTPILGFNRSRNGDSRSPDRPNLLPGRTAGNIILGTPERWFDPTAFALPEVGTYGNAGRNILIGPGLATVDTSLFKTTRIREKITVQFRAEVFNLLNHTNFSIPQQRIVLTQTGAISPTAGRITSTSTTSRQIQFGLKIIW